MKVAIQGLMGSFHHITADKLFDDPQIVEKETFRQVFESVENGESDKGVIAIENSIAGSILKNYDLLLEYGHWISGEYYLKIVHNLMALRGQTVEDINTVRSHPMALAQCDKYIRHKKLKSVEDFDTAGIAKIIQEEKLEGVGAIAGELAAEIYNLEIVASGIETDENNYTRFLVIQKERDNLKEANKTSIVVELNHKSGTLYEFLGIFYQNKVSMTKIESRPIVGELWKYRFYIDYLNNENSISENDLMQKLRDASEKLTILGNYISGR